MKTPLLAAILACAAGSAQAAGPACTDWGKRGALVYQDDFSGPFKGYVAEYAAKPGNTVETRDGRRPDKCYQAIIFHRGQWKSIYNW